MSGLSHRTGSHWGAGFRPQAHRDRPRSSPQCACYAPGGQRAIVLWYNTRPSSPRGAFGTAVQPRFETILQLRNSTSEIRNLRTNSKLETRKAKQIRNRRPNSKLEIRNSKQSRNSKTAMFATGQGLNPKHEYRNPKPENKFEARNSKQIRNRRANSKLEIPNSKQSRNSKTAMFETDHGTKIRSTKFEIRNNLEIRKRQCSKRARA